VRRALAALLLAALPLAACGPAAPAWDSAQRASSGAAEHRAAHPAAEGASARLPGRPEPVTDDPLSSASSEERAAVRDVLERIQAGGPFLHRRDGIEFANREHRLPPEPPGYYREYTVETPGAADRGARRLVVGRGGEAFYSDDHYRSFTPLGRVSGAAP